jgi:hypothetical protein
MIPTAEVLTQILKDPAIPAEAKPKHWNAMVTVYRECDALNAVVFFSLSQWLWEREEWYKLSRLAVGEWYEADPECNLGIKEPTPIEALAAVVREVAGRDARTRPE